MLFQLNTRLFLSALSQSIGRTATLDDIPDSDLVALSHDGFEYVWLLGVWQTGPIARVIASSHDGLLREYKRVIPDFTPDDVVASCFAISDYHVHSDYGGDDALARLRARMHKHGLKLILDFIPNHVAPDHRWATEHPEYFVRNSDGSLAYGKDPNFPGWSDTVQLNYGNPDVHNAMLNELQRIATQCDGVRCDMAMLVLPDVFKRTWGIEIQPFWQSVIATLKHKASSFKLIAEVYWDLESTMIDVGFDFAYDKRLYDRLKHAAHRPLQKSDSVLDREFVGPVHDHLKSNVMYQRHLVRFLENHDEERAASTFDIDAHKAAAALTFLLPGMGLVHQGQREGKRVRIPIQLRRGPHEHINEDIEQFYQQLLQTASDPVIRNGAWQLLETHPAWDGNHSNEGFIAFAWEYDGKGLVVIVNFTPHDGQCYVQVPWKEERVYVELSPWQTMISSDQQGASSKHD